jgi:hypothetical protein
MLRVQEIYISCTLTLFFYGCAAGGHQDFAALADREREQFQEGIGMEQECQTAILNNLIRSTDLEAFVDEALAANPGLQQTLLTLRIRQEQYRRTNSERWPEITAGYAAGREENSDPSYAGSISIGWEIDLWSKLADKTRAAAKDIAEQQALYQSARDSLAAQVMKTWLGLTAASKNITIESERLATFVDTETFILQRYRSGLCTLVVCFSYCCFPFGGHCFNDPAPDRSAGRPSGGGKAKCTATSGRIGCHRATGQLQRPGDRIWCGIAPL